MKTTKRISKPWVWKSEFCVESLADYSFASFLKSSDEKGKNLLALGSVQRTQIGSFNELANLRTENDWLFGYITYDAKNQLENLNSNNLNQHQLPDLEFHIPEIVIEWNNEQGWIHCLDSAEINLEELHYKLTTYKSLETNEANVQFKPQIDKLTYKKHITELKQEIQQGNIYEVNFCQNFSTKGTINPYQTFKRLNAISPTPFSGFIKTGNFYCLCASPERYLKKEGQVVSSQPIKGTIKRHQNEIIDAQLKEELRNSKKDQIENVMIVDLVRNDLSKSATKGSVQVKELFGIYSFPQVHQMISTVQSVLRADKTEVDVIKDSFPMGSMTGTPKIEAMNLIEQHEVFKRELYSGCIGYFTPNGNFDFNVVIRSLFYNQSLKHLSFAVGGAITIASDEELEYQESLLKAKAIFELF